MSALAIQGALNNLRDDIIEEGLSIKYSVLPSKFHKYDRETIAANMSQKIVELNQAVNQGAILDKNEKRLVKKIREWSNDNHDKPLREKAKSLIRNNYETARGVKEKIREFKAKKELREGLSIQIQENERPRLQRANTTSPIHIKHRAIDVVGNALYSLNHLVT